MIITYERDPNVGNGFAAFRGKLEWSLEDDPKSAVSKVFEGYDFGAIIREAHAQLPKNDSHIDFVRSDHPELLPYALYPEIVELVRSNPEEVIEQMAYPEIRVVVGRPPAPPSTLRSCSDTMADAFGTKVLCRRRQDLVECPGCGVWVPFSSSELHCPACSCTVSIEPCDSHWVYINVSELLEHNDNKKFFLPREWNGFGPWVSRQALEELYQEFLAKKENFK